MTLEEYKTKLEIHTKLLKELREMINKALKK